MSSYVIQSFISYYQDSYFQYDIDHSHQNQIQYFHVIPLQHLIYYFPAEWLNPLNIEQYNCSIAAY